MRRGRAERWRGEQQMRWQAGPSVHMPRHLSTSVPGPPAHGRVAVSSGAEHNRASNGARQAVARRRDAPCERLSTLTCRGSVRLCVELRAAVGARSNILWATAALAILEESKPKQSTQKGASEGNKRNETLREREPFLCVE